MLFREKDADVFCFDMQKKLPERSDSRKTPDSQALLIFDFTPS